MKRRKGFILYSIIYLFLEKHNTVYVHMCTEYKDCFKSDLINHLFFFFFYKLIAATSIYITGKMKDESYIFIWLKKGY